MRRYYLPIYHNQKQKKLPPNFFSALVYKTTTLTVVHNFKWLCAVKLTLN